MQTVAPDPAAPGGEARALRLRTIAGLRELIYAPGETGGAADSTFRPEHDPALRRRTEAVEVLGRFPDPEAAAVLTDLLLRGERDLPPPVGRWLRDTALLTLLRTTRLPGPAVAAALSQAYGFLRHPLPWQWSAVYDDLPLLARYHKLGLFFRAFWLWPLVILALAPLGLLWQIIANQSVGSVGGDADLSLLRDLGITLGTGLEIYLVHQVLVALLAGRLGTLLRVPNAAPRLKAIAGAGVALLVGAILVLVIGLIGAGTVTTGEGRAGFLLAAMVLPLFLLPMFILAHDLELAVRYAPRRQSWGLRAWAVLLRRLTDLIYILFLPTVGGLIWFDQINFGPASLGFLAYLYIVPLIVTGGLTLLKRLLRGGATARTLPGA